MQIIFCFNHFFKFQKEINIIGGFSVSISIDSVNSNIKYGEILRRKNCKKKKNSSSPVDKLVLEGQDLASKFNSEIVASGYRNISLNYLLFDIRKSKYGGKPCMRYIISGNMKNPGKNCSHFFIQIRGLEDLVIFLSSGREGGSF